MRLEDQFKYRPYKSRKVLLIDDEEDLGWILGKIIRDAGHIFIFASTFKKGMEKFMSSKSLDIAIIDLRLVDGDGLKFIKKARAVNDKVKLIMISAFGDSDIKEKARRLGASRFLDKPLKPERLLEIINHDCI